MLPPEDTRPDDAAQAAVSICRWSPARGEGGGRARRPGEPHGTRNDREAEIERIAAMVGVVAVALGAGSAWAQAKVTVTREASKPQTVEIKAGEGVRWVNASGRPRTSRSARTPAVLPGEGDNRVRLPSRGPMKAVQRSSGA